MDKLVSLNELFHNRIFRIPDYQRGYAWKEDQLKDFWEDLLNLSRDRSHYTGVLTLQQVTKVDDKANEYWLVNRGTGYTMFHIVDGQQRLITFIVFLQAFIEFFKKKNPNKLDKNIFIIKDWDLETVIKQYLYKTKVSGEQTLMLDYINDPLSSKCLRSLRNDPPSKQQ